jgi:hypothetical protein
MTVVSPKELLLFSLEELTISKDSVQVFRKILEALKLLDSLKSLVWVYPTLQRYPLPLDFIQDSTILITTQHNHDREMALQLYLLCAYFSENDPILTLLDSFSHSKLPQYKQIWIDNDLLPKPLGLAAITVLLFMKSPAPHFTNELLDYTSLLFTSQCHSIILNHLSSFLAQLSLSNRGISIDSSLKLTQAWLFYMISHENQIERSTLFKSFSTFCLIQDECFVKALIVDMISAPIPSIQTAAVYIIKEWIQAEKRFERDVFAATLLESHFLNASSTLYQPWLEESTKDPEPFFDHYNVTMQSLNLYLYLLMRKDISVHQLFVRFHPFLKTLAKSKNNINLYAETNSN